MLFRSEALAGIVCVFLCQRNTKESACELYLMESIKIVEYGATAITLESVLMVIHRSAMILLALFSLARLIMRLLCVYAILI